LAPYISRSPTRSRFPAAWIALVAILTAGLACSADNLIGQPPAGGPTPTQVPAFATTTPGGRVSVWLVTPTGQAGDVSPTPAPVGSIVAPAASATAAFATLRAATLSAALSPAAPVYQPTQCPASTNPPPPTRPAKFNDYPQAIGLYLSQGGATTTLETILRSWGALATNRGVVQADTDLTGAGFPEIIITLVDPALFNASGPTPGQLLVYGCSQGGYRLLYGTPYNNQTMLPELKRVGNMNGGSRAQLVYAQQFCATLGGTCTQNIEIMNWDSVIGAFSQLNDTPIDATNAKIKIGDIDGDGILEISLRIEPPVDVNGGPPRPYTVIWDWNSANYVKAEVVYDAPIYRIHAAYDADFTFEQGNFSAALKAYDKVRDDPNYQPWIDPNELTTLRAYAEFRKLLAYAALKQSRTVSDALTQLQTENPPGTVASGWVDLAAAFVDSYQKVRGLHKVCTTAIDFMNTRPDVLAALNSYGANNHSYTPAEICPF
jgi:hypothetical protein